MSTTVPRLPWHNPALPPPSYCIPYALAEAVAAAYVRAIPTNKKTLYYWARKHETSYRRLVTLRAVGYLEEPDPAEMTLLLGAFGHQVWPLLLTQPGHDPDLFFYVKSLDQAHSFDLATAGLLPMHLAGAYECTALRERAVSEIFRQSGRSAFLYFVETGYFDRVNGQYAVPTVIPAVLPHHPDANILDLEREALDKIQLAVEAYQEALGSLHCLAATLVVNQVTRPLPPTPVVEIAALENLLDYIRRLSPPPAV